MTHREWLLCRFEHFGLHQRVTLDGVGYGLGPTALASVPEVRYDFTHSTLSVGGGWLIDQWQAIRYLGGAKRTEAQLNAAYTWFYDSAPTGPDGGQVRFQNSQPDVRL